MKEISLTKITSANAPAAIGPYSQAVIAGRFLFTSGQIPLDPAIGTVIAEDIELQARQVMENCKAILSEAGYDLEDVVKTTCFLKDMKDFEVFNRVYGEYFPGRPARSCVAVREIPKNVLCEIELIAYK